MNDSLLQSDLDARAEALDISRSFLIQAPAGSGKTELLIQRYLCLLATVEQPEEVVAITFTRKAAQEMLNRVTEALVDARSGLAVTEHHRLVTRSAATKVLERDATEQWNLIINPGRMRIQTLDSFNAGIARSLPITSGIGGISRVSADSEMGMMLREAAGATLDWLTQDGPTGAGVREVLSHLDNNVSIYISYLSEMLQKRDQWLSLIGAGLGEEADYHQARARLESGIVEIIENQLVRARKKIPLEIEQDLAESLRYATANLLAADVDDPVWSGFANVSSIPAADVSSREKWQRLANALLTQSGTLRKSVTKNNGFPPGDDGQKRKFLDILDQLRLVDGLEYELSRVVSLPSERYTEDQWQVLVALFRLLPVSVAELRRLFAERSVCDHTEIAIAASAALGVGNSPGEAALMLDYRIRHVLLDEMQDTSLGQHHLIERLIEGWTPDDGRTLFCVGDPMQSVYRFRDAEVGQFVLARDNGIGSMKLDFRVLRQNFRSGENIVHWFNTVFGQIMPIEDDVSGGAISFSESISAEAQAGKGEVKVHPLINQGTSEEATYCAELLEDTLSANPNDSATLLVRSRTQLTELLPLLRLRGIEYQAVDIDRLTDLPEIIDLLALTRALCHDGDRIAWLGMLHGPLVGMTWEDILALVTGDSRSSVRELFMDEERLVELSKDGLVRLTSFLNTIDSYSSNASVDSLRVRVEQCWFALGGPAILRTKSELENAYQYLDVLERLETAGSLADTADLENLLDREHVSRAPTPDCRLQIMTMHKAKGLEFDHVIVYGLGRRTRGSQKSVLSWLSLPEGASSEMIVSPVGARSELENDPLHQFIEKAEDDKQRHELDRLLYVACTRAQKSLALIGNVQLSAKGDMNGPPSGSLLHRLWPAISGVYDQAFAKLDEEQIVSAGHAKTDLADPISRRFGIRWSAPEIKAVPVVTDQAALDREGETAVEFYWVGSAARFAGTVVHKWLQQITNSTEQVSSADELDHRPTSSLWARQSGVAAKDLEQVCDRVEAALDGILSDDKGQWLLQGSGHTELPLTGLWKGSVHSIVIDRIKVDDEGNHWIVDYKTSTHEGGDIAGFLEQEEGRYREQLRKYADIYGAMNEGIKIRKALYFPLLKQFRELE